MKLVDDINSRGVLAVLSAAGLDLVAQAFGPCPACGADRRGSRDTRPPARVFERDGETAWACFPCRSGGDATALAALVATGSSLSRANAPVVRAWAASRGLCTGDAGHTPSPVPVPRPKPAELPPVRRPPLLEVEELFALSLPVTKDAEVSAWLVTRGLSPADVDDRRLAFALPKTAVLPSWASCSGTWSDSGHRLVLPLYDSRGNLASVRARCVRKEAWPAKALAPTGCSTSGLVLADSLARLMLSGEELGDGSSAADLIRRVGLAVVEGEPDFLTWATRASEAADLAHAVVGLVAGSWSQEISERLPLGARVVVRTHADEAGDRYAQRVADLVGSRCFVMRASGGDS